MELYNDELCETVQVLSLSLEKNVKPKCMFLEEEVGGAARLIVVRPSFLGMSLDRR